jgi:hypothetical protein
MSEDSSTMDLTFTTFDDWAYVSVEGWIGENVDDIPMDEDGALDTENFPYYWCNSTGETTVVTDVEFKWSYNCEDLDQFSLSLVAHATLGKLLEDGTVDPDSEVSAFVFEHEKESSDGLFGWFDFVLSCKCADLGSASSAEASAATSETETCEPTVVVVDEDFEPNENGSWHVGAQYTWGQGISSVTDGFSHFLGRLGKGNGAAEESFVIPGAAESVTVEFMLYQIDQWTSEDDTFVVTVGSTDVSLGEMQSDSDSQLLSGDVSGIHWTREKVSSGSDIGFLSDNDSTFAVHLEIPAIMFADGKLHIKLEAIASNKIDLQSAGIDNFKITANYKCDGRRHLDGFVAPQLTKATSTKSNASSSEAYCKKEEYPCEGGTKVYVCHYSVFKGYSSFCVNEIDTDIIQFYPNDYCGPCVGGYGGLRHEAAPAAV